MAIGQAAPNLTSFAAGRGAAYIVMSIIARVPEIDSLSKEGLRPVELEGALAFKDVHFA